MDLLAKLVEHYEKVSAQETCEVCGDVGHSGNSYPETQEDLNFINTDNGLRPQQHQGWNQRSNNQGGNNYYSSPHVNNQGNNS